MVNMSEEKRSQILEKYDAADAASMKVSYQSSKKNVDQKKLTKSKEKLKPKAS